MRPLAMALLLCLSGAGAPAWGQEGGAPPAPGAPGHKSPKHGPNYVTYVGFQKLGEAPRVFLRISSPATPTQSIAGDELRVDLPGFRLDVANNARPLDTRYFGTAVVRVRAAEIKGATPGVEVHVTFAKGSAPTEAKISTGPAEDPDSGQYLYLDF